ncbi:MAG: DUF4062 domain-containing protein [Microbacterium sp.]
MKRLYDVFLSSTQRDLSEERRAISQAMLRTTFRPVQMETFPATRHRAEKLISDLVLVSDFVVLIIGTEYGSIIPESDMSFTELEYRRAIDSGIPVLIFLKRVGVVSELGERLQRFREHVMSAHTCQFWESTSELVEQVMQSLAWVSEDNAGGGWVRADQLSNDPTAFLDMVAEPAIDLGISRISVDGVAGPSMVEALSRAHSIKVMSTTGLSLIRTHQHALISAVKAGSHLQVLVPADDSEFLHDVEEIEGRDPSTDPLGIEVNLLRARLAEVNSGSAGAAGSIRLGRMTTHLRATMTLTENWGWLSLTLPPLRTSSTASFALSDSGPRALLRQLHQHFDSVWEIIEARGAVEVFR